MPLAVSKEVQDELLAIRADLETAMHKFIQDRHYGAAERMLVIVDRSLHNLIRDAAIVVQGPGEPRVDAIAVPCATASESGQRISYTIVTPRARVASGDGPRVRSAVKNQARRGSVDKQAALVVDDTSLRAADPAAPIEHRAFGPDRTRLGRDRPHE
jgi:hypothetical protein